MSTYEERCAAVARVDAERKERCERILERYKKKELEPKKPVKKRFSSKELKKAGIKYITE